MEGEIVNTTVIIAENEADFITLTAVVSQRLSLLSARLPTTNNSNNVTSVHDICYYATLLSCCYILFTLGNSVTLLVLIPGLFYLSNLLGIVSKLLILWVQSEI